MDWPHQARAVWLTGCGCVPLFYCGFCRRQTFPPLRSLDLGNADLRTDAVVALATALHRNTSLKELKLENPRLFSKTVSCQCT